jgi:hypothetical protein
MLKFLRICAAGLGLIVFALMVALLIAFIGAGIWAADFGL